MTDLNIEEKLTLSADEDFVLTAWQYRMMQRDIAASSGKQLPPKRNVRNDFRTAAVEAMVAREQSEWSPAVAEIVGRIGSNGNPDLEAFEDAGPVVSSVIDTRARALLLLIDLYGFEPWTEGKWNKDARRATLEEAHQAFDQLHAEDLSAVESAYEDALKKLSKSSTWIKYALLASAGLGLGVLTGGLAAPAIAGVYGTLVLGYSGAVATTAGMAALGGGSIAAGGLGMAGGAALIAGVSGALGAGAATLGGKVTGLTASQVAADAVRLHVVTQLVLRDVEGNEAAAKAVIVSMRERVATLGISLATLAAKYEEVSAQLQAKQAEVDAERKQRLATEDQFTRFRAVADRLLETVVGPDNEELKALRAELSQLDDEKKVASSLATGVASLADDLEEHL